MLFRNSLPTLEGAFRFFHAAANSGAIDIYSNGFILAKNISFGTMTDYNKVPVGTYNIQIYKAGTYDAPLFEENIEVTPNEILTLSVIILESTLTILKLKDGSTTADTSSLSFLRYINLSPNAPLLSLSLPNDITLFNKVEYLETTGYYTLSPGIYNFVVSSPSAEFLAKFINDITLSPGTFYTIYIIGLVDNQKPQLGSYIAIDGDIKNTAT